ncbi:hypothetical protein BB561_000050 [Smittium simulii]|uniref:RRM domain-containing protein n=1 Tax=Smittium simulii TaxID=133385 RepID=A0A2T9Z0T1_9FUNG|nr:hypothetical protein BB561_000050 [Smittium simulii]
MDNYNDASNNAASAVDSNNYSNENNLSNDQNLNTTSNSVSLEELEVNDPELAALKKQMMEMEQEAAKLRALQQQTTKSISDEQSKDEADSRSIYIGNVDYETTPEELQAHFSPYGVVNRVTILCDKWTGHPKGFAYIEFAEKSSVQASTQSEGSLLHGRPLKISPKRTNVPGVSRGRGRGGFYNQYNPYPQRGGYYMPRGRPYVRGGRGRGRGAAHFSPY